MYKEVVIIILFFMGAYGAFAIWMAHESLHQTQQTEDLYTQESYCPPPPTYVDHLIAEYEQHIIDEMKATHTPGVAVVIVKDGQIRYNMGFGTKKSGTYDPVDGNTVFRLASVSKGFAGVLATMLAHEGAFSLDQKVVDYLPDFSLGKPAYNHLLEIRHTLSHTTGLPYHTFSNLIESGETLDNMIASLNRVKAIAQPGKVYSYQNVAFSIIENIIEEATGCSYETLLHEKIFSPLKMHSASASFEGMLDNTNFSQPHNRTASGYRPIHISPNYYNTCAAGGLNASANDMGKWMLALLGHRQQVINKQHLYQAFTPQVETNQKWRYKRNWPQLKNTFYALGWRVFDYAEDEIIYHGGYANGFRSEIAINTKEQFGICVLSNGTGTLINKSIPTFLDMYACHAAGQPAKPSSVIASLQVPNGQGWHMLSQSLTSLGQ